MTRELPLRLLSILLLIAAFTMTGIFAAHGAENSETTNFNAPRTPLGFKNAGAFGEFGGNLNTGLRNAGYEDVQAIFQGSSVTGKRFGTEQPFDVGRVNDFDIALASPTLLQRAKDLGIPLRSQGTRSAPLEPAHLEKLGLSDVASQLSGQAGRPVNFMIYGTTDAAVSRVPSILVPR